MSKINISIKTSHVSTMICDLPDGAFFRLDRESDTIYIRSSVGCFGGVDLNDTVPCIFFKQGFLPGISFLLGSKIVEIVECNLDANLIVGG